MTMEIEYRLMNPKGEVLSTVRAETLQDAADYATNMGYKVIDTVSPEVVVVTTTEDSGEVAVSVVLKRNGECIITGTIPPAEAAAALRSVADSLEQGRGRYQ